MNYYIEYVTSKKRIARIGPFKAKKHAERHKARCGLTQAKIINVEPPEQDNRDSQRM